MKRAMIFVALALVFLFAACGGTAPSLSVSPAIATVTAGDGPTSFSAALSGASGAISWSLSPELGTLSSSTGPSVNYTPPAAVANEQTVTLTASAAGLSASATITVEPRTTDVAGTLTDIFGNPLAGKRVVVPGRAPVTTGAGGSFSFDDVVVPYSVIAENSSSQYTVFEGLTRSNPRLFAYAGSSAPYHASGTGTVSGTHAGNTLSIQYAGDGGAFTGTYGSSAGSTDISISATMYKPTVTADLFALEWTTDASGNADDFVARGKRPGVTLNDGDALSGLDLTLTSLSATTHDLSVQFAIPAMLTTRTLAAGVKISPVGVPAWGSLTAIAHPANPEAVFRAPGDRNFRMTLTGTFRDADGNDSVVWVTTPATSSSAAATVPEPPILYEPADGAAGVTPATGFAWNGPDDVIYMLHFANPSFEVRVFTAAKQTHLPDLSAFGTSYPSDADFEAQVECYRFDGLYGSDLDLFTSSSLVPFGLAMVSARIGMPLTESGLQMASKKYTYTTAP